MFLREESRKLTLKQMGIDLVFECTGLFTSKKKPTYLKAGAKRVIISAPGNDVDKTIVFGVNHSSLNSNHKVISSFMHNKLSCTNC